MHVELIARLGLAGVFALSGAAKLADLPGSRQAFGAAGLPPAPARVAGALLPLAELATAAALLFAASAWFGGLAALALGLALSAGIANVLRRREEADCHCFGSIWSATMGPWTLIRSLVLTALAALVLGSV
jgi:uncharacterized membrane protein YphA (DoxX/SURF4 family)